MGRYAVRPSARRWLGFGSLATGISVAVVAACDGGSSVDGPRGVQRQPLRATLSFTFPIEQSLVETPLYGTERITLGNHALVRSGGRDAIVGSGTSIDVGCGSIAAG